MKSTFTLFSNSFLTLCLLLASAGLIAQPCEIDQPIGNETATLHSNNIVGQTFTACGSGVITEVRVFVRDSVGKTLTFELFNADDRTTALDSQQVVVDGAGVVSVLLEEPLAVVDGGQYAFSFRGITEPSGAASFLGTRGDPYAGGNLYQILNGNLSNVFDGDLEFTLSIVPNACTQAQPASTQNFFLTPLGIGQVFKSCAKGALTDVSVEFETVDTDSLYLEIVSADSIESPLYRQLILNPTVGNMTIELETPFLVDTFMYGFLLKKTARDTDRETRVRVSNQNPYTPATLIEIVENRVLLPASFDMKFGVTIVEPVNLIDQPEFNAFWNSSSAITVGQSFTAPKNGRISHIRFSTVGDRLTEVRLDLNLGSDTNGADYSQVSQISGSGDHLITLHQGFNVLEGETYAFSITATNDSTDNIWGFNGDPYTGGRTFTINDGAVTPFGSDLDFSILTFEDEGVVSVPNVGDLSTHLHDAHPNPASGQFTVSYSLDQSREVMIELYDLTGRQLRQIRKGRQPAGEYRETINVSNLPAGMYVYGLRTETGHSVTKRIVVN